VVDDNFDQYREVDWSYAGKIARMVMVHISQKYFGMGYLGRRAFWLLLMCVFMMAMAGCTRTLRSEKEVIHQDTLKMQGVTCRPVVAGGALELRFEQLYTADAETVRRYEKNNLIFYDMAVGIATLGAVDTRYSTESSGVRRKTFRRPLKNGTPLSGFVKLHNAATGKRIYTKPLACNVDGSVVMLPLPKGADCVRVSFEGELRTMERNVAVAVDEKSVCR
jgi:hypothetical protein